MKRGRPPSPDLLTPREREVFVLVKKGLTNEEIARRLGISHDGAKYHVGQILSKLGISTRHDTARWHVDEQGRTRLHGSVLAALVKSRVGPMLLAGKATAVAFATLLGLVVFVAVLASSAGRSPETGSAPASSATAEVTTVIPEATNSPSRLVLLDPVPLDAQGVINQITFGPDFEAISHELAADCISRGGKLKDGGQAEFDSSDLKFELGYLPVGARLVSVFVTLCDEDVLWANGSYGGGAAGSFQVQRRRGPLTIRSGPVATDLRQSTATRP